LSFTVSMVGEAMFVMVRDWLDNTKTREKPLSPEEQIMEEALTVEAVASLEREHQSQKLTDSATPDLTEKQRMLRAQSVRKLTKAKSLRQVVVGLREVGRLDEAESLARKILSARRQMYGDAHVATAHANNQLGTVFAHKGRYGDAMLQFQKGIEGVRAALGPNSLCEASLLQNQANAAVMQAEQSKSPEVRRMLFEEASRYGQLAGDVFEKRFGANHEKTVRIRRAWALGF